MSLGEKGSDYIYRYCIDNSCVALGWGSDIDYKNCESIEEIKDIYLSTYPDAEINKFELEAVKRFKVWMKKDDIVVISDGNKMAKAIGRITGDYRYEDQSEIFYKHFRDVEWLYVGDSIDVSKVLLVKQFSQQSIYMFYNNDLNMDGIRSLISSDSVEAPENNNYVLIIDKLVSIMKNSVIPLIQEYFYGDWEKTMLVLGGVGNAYNTNYFISREKIDAKKLFKGMKVESYQEQYNYSIVENPSKEAFLNIYEDNEE